MLKRILFAVMFTAVLSASALSVRQLGTGARRNFYHLRKTLSVTATSTVKSHASCFGLFNGNTVRGCQPEGSGACTNQMS